MKLFLAIAALGLSITGASACDWQRSAKLDTTVVASITAPDAAMSTAQDALPQREEPTVKSEEKAD